MEQHPTVTTIENTIPVRQCLAFEMAERRTKLGEGGIWLQKQPSTTEKHTFHNVTACSLPLTINANIRLVIMLPEVHVHVHVLHVYLNLESTSTFQY